MIAALEWIPAGRADPTPSKYEYSRAEKEFLARVQAGDLAGEDAPGAAEIGIADDGKKATATGGSDEEWEDVDAAGNNVEEEDGEDNNDAASKLPKVDMKSLPADLRMDEYSDGEDGNEEGVGGLLVGQDAEMMGDIPPEEEEAPVEDTVEEVDYDSSDSDDDDDLADVPDTREYMPVDVAGLQSLGIGGSGGYTMEDLQNMTMNNNELDDDEDDEEDEEDMDDMKIHDTDALIVVAKTEEDFASLEINVFDLKSTNLYIHHDIPLPSFPLCLATGSVVSSYKGSRDNGGVVSGNYVAVGSFEPGIEIWNLDVMNALEPTLVLGGMDTSGAEEDWMRQMPTSSTIGGSKTGGGKKKKKKKKGAKANNGLRDGSHTDAVMGLSWNAVHAQVLASGSADGTVKLWDVTQTSGDYVRPSATLTHHTDKVQSLAWHPSEGTLLATGGYDRKICLVDARSASSGNQSTVKKAKLSADCEAIAWDPHNQQYLTAASEDGYVRCWDVRKFGGSDGEPVWSLVAHEYGGVSDICYNPHVPGMLITSSIDKTVALWDTNKLQNNSPTPCGSKDMNVGRLHTVSCYPSSPWLLACGGSGNELAIWDMESEDAIRNRFADRVNGGTAAVEASKEEPEEPDYEALMAAEENAKATENALKSMNKSKNKKKGGGKKKNKAHKKK